jgi:hypothetical protein
VFFKSFEKVDLVSIIMQTSLKTRLLPVLYYESDQICFVFKKKYSGIVNASETTYFLNIKMTTY